MDRRLALGAAIGAPALYALLVALSSAVDPLQAWALGLLAYWAALAWAIGRSADRYALWEMAERRWPGWAIAVAMTVPTLALGAWALRLLGPVLVPEHLILAAAMGALVNGVLEELFWRGVLLRDPTPGAAMGSLGLFALFHLAWSGARGLEVPGGPVWMAAVALAMGGAWTAARLHTGTVGASILGHVAFGIFAFVGTVALNL